MHIYLFELIPPSENLVKLNIVQSTFHGFCSFSSEAKVHKSQDEEFHCGEGRKFCQDHSEL